MADTVAIPVVTSDAEYFAAPGLSNSALKDLEVSPLRFWYCHVNPNRPTIEPSAEMQFGTALHCAALEPDQFPIRYAPEISPADFDGCLQTCDDLRAWIRDRGQAPRGTRKADLIAQAQGIDADVAIFESIQATYGQQNAGKTLLSKDDFARVRRAADALLDEPVVRGILSDGQAELPIFAVDPDTGVLLKAKLDWTTPELILDIKTFSQKRGKTIDRTIAEAIWWERYYRQAYFYSMLREIRDGWTGEFVFAFVESEEPHEVRIRTMRSDNLAGTQPNVYWETAAVEVRQMLRKYAEYSKHFGEKPWRFAAGAELVRDEDLPGLGW